jgi:hypothetical protein
MRDWVFRMTSPYDPLCDGVSNDINIGAGVARAVTAPLGDAKNDFARNVAYWDYYASLYNYYSVISCRYKVRVENHSLDKFYVHSMFVTNTNPPANASNWDMLIWKGVKSQLIHPIGRFADQNTNAFNHREEDGVQMDLDPPINPLNINQGALASTQQIVHNPVGSSFCYIAGEYRPGQNDQMIHEDADVNVWAAVNSNPSLREGLLIRVRPYDNSSVPTAGDGNTYERFLSYNISVEIEYLVEFKELDPEIRWPTNRNPIIVINNNDPRSAGVL